MEDLLQQMQIIIAKLNAWTQSYDEGNPVVSDELWDEKYFKLVKLENMTGVCLPNSPTQTISYEVVNALNKVEHNHKMLSLDKTKDTEEVMNFIGSHEYLAMLKMDGLTCSLCYENGYLVSAETRGNGIVGEDIFHNAKVIPSIPKRIPYKEKLVVDGEIICSYDDFEEFSEEYKNPRNFASGSIRLLDSKECQSRKLKFIAWEVIEGFNEINFLNEKFAKLMELNFTVVPHQLFPKNATFSENDVETFKEAAANLKYPIDGLVFKFNDIAYGKSQGETTHHFKNAIAYKFYDEVYETTIIDIEYTMGRTGVLTPVAIFEPIDIDGSTVEKASLHNLSVMTDLMGHPWVGQKVGVFKANMIIPQISWAEEDDDRTKMYLNSPDVCPICGKATKIEVSDSGVHQLVCSNPDCEGKLINKLDHFCGKKGLDIKGLSKATLEKIIDWGWVASIAGIFDLSDYEKEWQNKPGFGVKSVSNILNAIEVAKDCELWQFISSLGIPLVGSTYAKTLAKNFETYSDFRLAVNDKNYHFYNIDGFGPEIDYALKHYDYHTADKVIGMVKEKNCYFSDNKENTNNNSSLEGLTFVITGKLTTFKNRAALQEKIESLGGKVVGSVSKNTSYLINNDSTSTSSKNLTAQKLGVEIITEFEFIEKFC